MANRSNISLPFNGFNTIPGTTLSGCNMRAPFCYTTKDKNTCSPENGLPVVVLGWGNRCILAVYQKEALYSKTVT